MNKVIRVSLLLILLFGASSIMGKEHTTKEQIKLGEKLFARNCTPCHGVKAIGQNPKQRNGGEDENGILQAPGLNGKAHAWHHPDSVLFKYVKQGSILQESPMKGWEGRMSDEEMWAVIRYFQSLWPEKLRKFQEKRSQSL